jgi:hypothetical protein
MIGSAVIGCCAVVAVAAPGEKGAEQAAKPAAPAAGAATPITPEAAEFFENKVRPVLVESCAPCHDAKLQQSGLRVDTLAGLLRGSDSGHAGVVPGDPNKSSLIQAVRFDGAIKMPPKGKLPQAQIDALTTWVKMGAPWPNADKEAPGAAKPDPKKHWAFQPVRKPAQPAVKNKWWVKTPIDALVLAKLEAKGLKPSPVADRPTLIRRAYYDMIGLPPTAAEIQTFVNDRSPEAWSKVVDGLLANPHYGERWGRYWLDVARYADNKGYIFTEERRFPWAYTYRDYVIRSLNEDKPYDRFLTEQIAADHLELGDDKRPLAAMGFLTLGRRFLGNQPDIVDDRIDVVMRGTQGMTVGCARCHDHKFDPIPTKDYYSLYAVFASSTEPQDLPIIAEPTRTQEYLAYEKQLRALEGEADKFRNAKHGEVVARAKSKIADSLLAAREAKLPGADLRTIGQQRELTGALVRRWVSFMDATKSGHAVFAPWHALTALPSAEFAAGSKKISEDLADNKLGDTVVNAKVAQLFVGMPPASLQDAAERYAKLLTTPPADDQQLVNALDSIGGPLNLNPEESVQLYNRAEREELQKLRKAVEVFKGSSPAAPPRAHALVDLPKPVTQHVFKRGNPNSPGDVVPAQFLTVLSGPDRQPFKKGSGRLELAEAITSKENPLTARVMVNRVWMGHFGTPLVNTPSDFGLRSDPPTNPELLDYMAARFMENNWSLKKLHREILLSNVYLQRSDDRAEARKVDPENALYWRMNRRRLDFEAMRDSILAAAGDLDETVFGQSVDITQAPFPRRRAIYAFIDRQNLPNIFRTFDYASPDTTSPQRYFTTVPQQALFLMNNPFVIERAKSLAARKDVVATTPKDRIEAMYRAAYGRAAAPDEVKLGEQFLKLVEASGTEGASQDANVWEYGYGTVDDAAAKVTAFQALPHFTGTAWQGGAQLPDPKTGWVILNAVGGHPGNDAQHSAIRRWVAPRDMMVSIDGMLKHPSVEGDGVRARILSSRGGVLGTWTAEHATATTAVAKIAVKKGDTLDFVVDCRTNPNHDGFEWAPVVRADEKPVEKMEERVETVWSAASGFSGPRAAKTPPLTAWEKYAQVLLLSNEFMFVD